MDRQTVQSWLFLMCFCSFLSSSSSSSSSSSFFFFFFFFFFLQIQPSQPHPTTEHKRGKTVCSEPVLVNTSSSPHRASDEEPVCTDDVGPTIPVGGLERKRQPPGSVTSQRWRRARVVSESDDDDDDHDVAVVAPRADCESSSRTATSRSSESRNRRARIVDSDSDSDGQAAGERDTTCAKAEAIQVDFDLLGDSCLGDDGDTSGGDACPVIPLERLTIEDSPILSPCVASPSTAEASIVSSSSSVLVAQSSPSHEAAMSCDPSELGESPPCGGSLISVDSDCDVASDGVRKVLNFNSEEHAQDSAALAEDNNFGISSGIPEESFVADDDVRTVSPSTSQQERSPEILMSGSVPNSPSFAQSSEIAPVEYEAISTMSPSARKNNLSPDASSQSVPSAECDADALCQRLVFCGSVSPDSLASTSPATADNGEALVNARILASTPVLALMPFRSRLCLSEVMMSISCRGNPVLVHITWRIHQPTLRAWSQQDRKMATGKQWVTR